MFQGIKAVADNLSLSGVQSRQQESAREKSSRIVSYKVALAFEKSVSEFITAYNSADPHNICICREAVNIDMLTTITSFWTISRSGVQLAPVPSSDCQGENNKRK